MFVCWMLSIAAASELQVEPLKLVTAEDTATSVTLRASADGVAQTSLFTLAKKPRLGTATIDEATGLLTFTPHKDNFGADQLVVDVRAGTAHKRVTVAITVEAVNDPPLVEAMILQTPEETATSLRLTVVDVDGGPLVFALANDAAKGSASVDAKGRVRYTPKADATGSDRFFISVSDGIASTRLGVDVVITGVNDAPVVGPASLTGREDEGAKITLSASDVDGDPVSWSIAKAPAHGSATIDAKSGILSFTPAKDWHGSDSVGISAKDPGGLSASSVVAVVVAAVNDAPKVEAMNLATREREGVNLPLTVSDVDGDAQTFSIGTPAKLGSASVDAKGRVSYQPSLNNNGADRFVVLVGDGTTQTNAPVDVVIAAVNEVPVIATAQLSGNEDTMATKTLSASDPDGDTLLWSIAKAPAHGSATIDAKSGMLSFTPAKDWHGSDSVGVAAKDPGGLSASSVVAVVVAAVNDAPVVEAMKLVTREREGVNLPLTVSDVDGDAQTFSIGTPAKLGSASVDAKGRVSYQPSLNNNGADRFVVLVGDGTTQTNAPVDVVIAAVNEVPVIATAQLSGNEDTVATKTLSASDPDGDTLLWSIAKAPAHGSATIDAKSGMLSFTPAKDWHGSDSVGVAAKDPGGLSASSVVAVVVAAVNDAPVVEALQLSLPEDERSVGALVVKDVDGDALSFSVLSAPAKGDASVDAKGVVTYKGALNQNGADRFVVVVNDGKVKVESAVEVVVAAVNDAPVAVVGPINGVEDIETVITLQGSDVDGDALSWSITKAPEHGSANLDGQGRLTFAPSKNWHGKDAVQVTLKDASTSTSATVPVMVEAQNDAPTAEALSITTREDEQVNAVVSAADLDGDVISWSISPKGQPAHGSARVDAKGRVSYQPSTDHNGQDRFVVVVSDAKLSAEAQVSVVITPVNDAPKATAAALSVAEDGTLNTQLQGSDVDGDALAFTLVKGPPGARLDKTGALSWSPPSDFHGVETLVFDVDDGKLGARGQAVVTVTPVNDAPKLTTQAMATAEDKRGESLVHANDIDGDALLFRISRQGAKGEASVDPKSGAVSYLPQADVWGEDVVVVAVDDGTTSSEAPMAVSISPVPDAPRTQKATWQLREDTPDQTNLPGIDVDGDALTFTLTSQPRLGSARLVDEHKGIVAFAPRQDEHGSDEVRFDVNDGVTKVAGTLAMTIAAVNDTPVATPLALSTKEDQAVSATIAMSDVDADALKLVVVEPSPHATVKIDNANKGTLTVEPARDFTGDLVFQVAASEGAKGLVSAPVEVKVSVGPENDAPVAQTQTRSTPEDTPISELLVARDVDGDALEYRLQKAPELGTVVIDAASGRFHYTPRKNVFGDDAFIYVAKDAKLSSSARVSLRIEPVDDPPVASPGTLISPRAGRVTGKLLGRDAEGSSLVFRIIKQPSIGTAVILDEHTGAYAYTPEGGRSSGLTSFAFVVIAAGQASEPALISVDVK